MAFKLSNRSYRRLEGVDDRLIELCELAITRTPIDFGIAYLGGFRTEEEQNDLFKAGMSKKDGYANKSKHQIGKAIDFIAFVGNDVVDDENMLSVIAGVFFSCASELDLQIRWGLDWDMDGDTRDTNFRDIFHIELVI